VALPTELPKPLFAGCAINLFFNKLLEQNQNHCTQRQESQTGFFTKKNPTHSSRAGYTYSGSPLSPGDVDPLTCCRSVGTRSLLKNAPKQRARRKIPWPSHCPGEGIVYRLCCQSVFQQAPRAFSLLLCTGKRSEVRLFFHPSEPTPSSLGDPGLEEKPRRDWLLCIHQK
jgi:hypothetical protein